METSQLEIGRRIQQARKHANFTQEGLGSHLNVQGPSVSKYESGDVDPGTVGLVIIAKVTKTPIAWLATGEGPGPGEGYSHTNEKQSEYIRGGSSIPNGLTIPGMVIMRTVIEGVEEYLEEEELELRPSKKADLIITLFEMCMEEGKEVDKNTIVRLVRLAA